MNFSPHATGELFEELKKGREEPDPAKAAGVTVDAADEFNTERYNPNIMDFLSKLPGKIWPLDQLNVLIMMLKTICCSLLTCKLFIYRLHVSGVTTKNIFALMNRLEDMNDLLERSEEELTEILGHSANAKELYESLHGNLLPLDQQAANQKAKSKGTSRFKTSKPKAPINKWVCVFERSKSTKTNVKSSVKPGSEETNCDSKRVLHLKSKELKFFVFFYWLCCFKKSSTESLAQTKSHCDIWNKNTETNPSQL